MSYIPDKKEVRRVYAQGATGEPISEWANEFDQWYFTEIDSAERRGAVRALREAAEMLEDAANLHVHPTHQVASEALHIAQRRLEHRAEIIEGNHGE